MIPDNMSSTSAGAVTNGENLTGVASSAAENLISTTLPDCTNTSPLQTSTTTVSAINSNTFVVKLKPSIDNGDSSLRDNGTPKTTNLLQLFCENGNRKNVSVVKALGIGKIVVNRTLLKKTKKVTLPFSANSHLSPPTAPLCAPKNPRTGLGKHSTSTISVSVAPTNGNGRIGDARFVKMMNRSTEKRSFIPTHSQSLPVQNEKENRKEDDLGVNLVNFMNFRLSNLVPKPGPDVTDTTPIKSSKNDPDKFITLTNPDLKSSMKHSSQSPLKPQNGDTKSSESSDNDLTSLAWLTGNDKSLIKTLRSCNPDDAGISLSGDDESEDDSDTVPSSNKAVFTAKSKVDGGSQTGHGNRPYDQAYNPNGKPPYSFSCLIFMAVEDSPAKKLPVKDIYAWVCKHFPYFLTAPSGWKNSIRHNLSLNKCFKKADHGKHSQEPGKGSLWCIDPAYRPNLIQALKRTPFYPYLYPGGVGQPLSLNNLASLLPGVRSGKIPLWSPSLSATSNSAWADPDVASAAWNLMGLKGNDAIEKQSDNVKSTIEELAKEIFNQRKRSRQRTISSNSQESVGTIPLVITDPSEDHTYSCLSVDVDSQSDVTSDRRCFTPDSEKSAPDAAYEFETCGTDIESDIELAMDSSGALSDIAESDCDLADSGFAGLRRGRRKARLASAQRNAKKRKSDGQQQRGGGSKRSKSSGRSKAASRPNKTLKVRFQNKNKKKNDNLSKTTKKKKIPAKADLYPSSDGDSGKDSPKIIKKSRSRVKTVEPASCYTKPYKTKRASSPAKPAATSPYGTRSTTQPRHSKRIAAGKKFLLREERLRHIAPRKRRKESGCNDTEDEEEIKLAAGSLLHLAGFRSPSSA